jgi:hypothetical protein
MLNKADLAKALNGIKPTSFSGKVARRVSFEGLLSPLAKGGTLSDLNFLYASRLRNRFTRRGGPQTIYFGEDEDVGSAETKRASLLGSFAKTSADPTVVFWAEALLPDAVLDLTDAAVVAALGSTDAEIYDPEWRDKHPISPSELIGQMAFSSGRFSAIKYWSVRSRMAGRDAFCLCIFKTRVQAPRKVTFDFKAYGKTEIWGG